MTDQIYDTLQSFVCDEKIERFRGALDSTRTRQVDTLTSTVSFENGVEHYTEIRQDDRPKPALDSIAGAWSEGEFGTLLRQTKQLMGVEPVSFRDYEPVEGERAALYEFSVPQEDSPWDLVIDSRHYRVPFLSRVWVSPESGAILQVLRSSTSIARGAGISGIQWKIGLRPVTMKGINWLLPASGEYTVSYADLNRREWNRLTFSNYHRYGSEAKLRFVE